MRVKQPAIVARVEKLTDRLLADALGRDSSKERSANGSG